MSKRKVKTQKFADNQPIFDSTVIREQMAGKQITVEDLVAKTKLGAPTITRARMGYDLRMSSLKKICKPLGLIVKIERPAA